MSAQNHRSRVANDKRERMRMRLIESALRVFAFKGADAAVIEDVISRAKVSRGTFYNYFPTNQELLSAVVKELGDELLALVESVVIQLTDPAERLATGIRMTLHTIRAHPLLAQFVARSGVSVAAQDSLALTYIPRDIQAGMASGQFELASVHVGMVLVLGTVHAAVVAMTSQLPTLPALLPNFPEEFTYHLLLALGITTKAARSLVSVPIQPVVFPVHALLARTKPGAEIT